MAVHVGIRIKHLVEKSGIEHKEFGRMLGFSGPDYIHTGIYKKKSISLDLMNRVAAILKIEPDEILKGRDNVVNEYEPDMYLFSSNQQPGYHLLNEKYFCMRFRKYKDLHGFGRNHTMYGLKHTFISQMKRQGATDKELLNITGLVTIEALYKYLKDIGAVEPADMSDKYLVTF